MTEEVKKILNNFIKIVKKPTYTKETYDGNLATLFKTYTLETSEVETLLNYITNLQKENENLLYEINGYLEEKERLKEKINKLEDYKQRNEKAVEFVKNMEYCGQEDYFYDLKSKDPCGNDNTFDDSKYKLLNILQGGDE